MVAPIKDKLWRLNDLGFEKLLESYFWVHDLHFNFIDDAFIDNDGKSNNLMSRNKGNDAVS